MFTDTISINPDTKSVMYGLFSFTDKFKWG